MAAEECDVVVVGGGPGGTTAASVIAMDGHRVVLLEKETFPRYQIGESLLPSTIHGILPLLGVRDEVMRAGFVVKNGGTFRWGSSPEPWTFSFAASPTMIELGAYGYQVERSKFDSILLNNAKRLGVDVRQQSRAVGVLRDGGRVSGVSFMNEDGDAREIGARFVVDASGHGSRLHNAVGGSREYSPFFRNLAVFSYFEDGARLPRPNSGNILCAAFGRGWFWYIPLSDRLTSVGAVLGVDDAADVQKDPEAALDQLISECPIIAEHLADAHRSKEEPYDRVRVRKDFSYDRISLWSPGMVLVGDAGAFIDPVFSSGVHLSTYSALLAARSINSVLAGVVEETRSFDEFEARYQREFAVFRDFLVAFYKMHVAEETYYWEAKQIAQHDGSVLEAFVDLVGGMSGGDVTPPGGLPMAARTMPIPPQVLGAFAANMEMGMRDMQGQATPALAAASGRELMVSPDGRRWVPVASQPGHC
jgi:halogenation protein CepH